MRQFDVLQTRKCRPTRRRQYAGYEQSVASIFIGVVNRSMETGLPAQINDLCEVQPGAVNLRELI
jgi:hypothetical protein